MAEKIHFGILFILLLFVTFKKCHAEKEEQVESKEFCEPTDTGIQCISVEDLQLTRLKSEEVGEERDIEVDDGKVLKLKTINTKPLIFEIDDFLSQKECEHFISVAKEKGLKSSYTQNSDQVKGVNVMDTNEDNVLDLTEMKMTLERSYDVYLDENDVLDMYKALNIDPNNDQLVSKEELQNTQPKAMSKYIHNLVHHHPEIHSRYSNNAWIFQDEMADDILDKVTQRVAKVVELPLSLMKLSDIQVVKYGVQGHYNAHLDSSSLRENKDCCDRVKSKNCRICRYMTVLFYLNNVKGGGETAFPVANNETINQWEILEKGVQDLFRKCDAANLHVAPSLGKAIIWYNHEINPITGWMGDVDRYTLHGGCPVTEGQKWVANYWVKVTDDKQLDIGRMNGVNKKSAEEKVDVQEEKDEL